MSKATHHTVKHANRPGFYRIAYALPRSAVRYSGQWVERVVNAETAARFAARHGIPMPAAANKNR